VVGLLVYHHVLRKEYVLLGVTLYVCHDLFYFLSYSLGCFLSLFALAICNDSCVEDVIKIYLSCHVDNVLFYKLFKKLCDQKTQAQMHCTGFFLCFVFCGG
jgi:hypothetical protein